MTVRFEEMFRGWLPAMKADQSFYDLDPDSMMPTELRDHIAQLGLGLADEAMEFVREFQWKYWKAIDVFDFPYARDKQRVVDEAVDVLHFLAHLLNVAHVTEDELNTAMYVKRQENERRQRDGYSYGQHGTR